MGTLVLSMRLTLAGSVISADGATEYRVGGRHPPVLLALLAAERHRVVPREELAEALWAEDAPPSWEASLRMALSKVRAFLVARGFEPAALRSTTGGYQLKLDNRLVLDFLSARELVEDADRALAGGQVDLAKECAKEARLVLDSPFLPGSSGPWVDARRYGARALLVRALELEASACCRTDHFGQAVAAAQRAIELEPFRESAYRALMWAHALGGNKAEALSAYERCRRVVSEELGVDPAPATEAVYLQVLRDELPPVSSVATTPPHQVPLELDVSPGPQELERLGEAALWAGNHSDSIAARQKAHRAYLARGDRRAAARVALALSSNHGIRSQLAEAEGWFRTAARLLENEPECAEHGLLSAVGAIVLFELGDLDACNQQAGRALEIGERMDIPDLRALGIAFQGLSRARQDQPADALPMLDEAMALALAGGVTPFTAGMIFCRTIRTSLDLFDYRRAAEWIQAIVRSANETGFSGYPGDCAAHLAAALDARGSWSEAEREAERACQTCEGFELAHVGLAAYTLGEIQRRRGEVQRAEEAFRRASEHGIIPQPGLALLQLSRADPASAFASIKACLDTSSIRQERARVLPSAVEIGLAAGDVSWSRAAATELAAIAAIFGTAALRAAACCAHGAVALAEGDAPGAARELRRAAELFRQAEMPYQIARARKQLADALLAVGDRTGAMLELQAAQRMFDRLGARPEAREAEQRLGHLQTARRTGSEHSRWGVGPQTRSTAE